MGTQPGRLRWIFDGCLRVVQGLAILALPLTSFPFLSRAMGGTTVAPLTMVPVFLLVVAWLPGYLYRDGRLPPETRPFLVFVIIALIATGAGFFLPLPFLKGARPQSEVISALITLAVGTATYLVFSLGFRSEGQFSWVLRLVNWGGLVMLAWSFLQLFFILTRDGVYPELITRIQSWVSIRGLLFKGFQTRVTGLAYEPSWQAHILNVVYLPYWLAASVTGYSSWRKVFHLSAENLMLAGGVIILVFTKSRIGMLAFLVIMALLFYELNIWAVGRLRSRLAARMGDAQRKVRNGLPVLLGFTMAIAYIGLGLGLVFLMASLDPRMHKLVSLAGLPQNLLDLALRVNFAERVMYWTVGWTAFAHYPLMGVGLGNTGFFFRQYLPYQGLRLSEVLDLLNQVTYLPNVKSLWVRLLSETGLLGFSLFTTWQVVLWQAGRTLRHNTRILPRTIGWMGMFAILAFLAEGFSIDSFALPYLWVSMGLLTAAVAASRRVELGPSGEAHG